MGVSQSRNPGLAAVLYRMRLIESYGTGISKIQRLYRDAAESPVFETAEGVFRTTLPNRNEEARIEYYTGGYGDSCVERVAESPASYAAARKNQKTERSGIRWEKDLVLSYAEDNGSVTRKEVEELLDIKTTKAFRILKELCGDGRLRQEGNGKLSRYYEVHK